MQPLNGVNMAFNKAQCESTFSFHFGTQPNGLGATRSNIMRLLRSVDLMGWSTHEESGRLDRKAFARFATGDVNVFAQRKYVEAEKSAVTILVDCSGSMGNDGRIGTAQAVCIQLARVLDKSSVAYNVTGFSGGRGTDYAWTSNTLKHDLATPIERTTFIPFKTWKDSLTKASAKLGSMHSWAHDSTPDYSAITLTLEDLARREEHRKILFLLTDADGYNKVHMQHLQSVANKLGIKIIAIGIGNTKVAQCFDNAQNVHSVDGLASASFNKLLKELR
jgi:cobalamin biosynthesis protein CobT